MVTISHTSNKIDNLTTLRVLCNQIIDGQIYPYLEFETACKERIDSLCKFESVSEQTLFHINRTYKFDDMVEFYIIAEILLLLRRIKYRKCIANIRCTLKKFLHSFYSLSDTDILNYLKADFPTTDMLVSSDDLFFTSSLVKKNYIESDYYDDSYSAMPGKSIRTLITDFLESELFHMVSSDLYYRSARYNKMSYLCAGTALPEITLLFTYYDGRSYNNFKPDSSEPRKRIHKRDSHKSCSPQALVNVYNVLSKYQPEDYMHNFCMHFSCESYFPFIKIQMLNKHYDEYMQSDFLSVLISSYHLSYDDIMTLKNVVENDIFFDKDFVIAGLKSQLFDFFSVFDIMFRLYYCGNIPYQHGVGVLHQKINECKESTKHLLSIDFFGSNLTTAKAVPIKSDEKFDVAATISSLENILKQNDFYKTYFSTKGSELSAIDLPDSYFNSEQTPNDNNFIWSNADAFNDLLKEYWKTKELI